MSAQTLKWCGTLPSNQKLRAPKCKVKSIAADKSVRPDSAPMSECERPARAASSSEASRLAVQLGIDLLSPAAWFPSSEPELSINIIRSLDFLLVGNCAAMRRATSLRAVSRSIFKRPRQPFDALLRSCRSPPPAGPDSRPFRLPESAPPRRWQWHADRLADFFHPLLLPPNHGRMNDPIQLMNPR